MLHFLFQIGPDRYAIDAAQIREVIPLVHPQPLAHTPAYVAGVIHYRGCVVPVEMDGATLAALSAGRCADVALEVLAWGRMPLAFSAQTAASC